MKLYRFVAADNYRAIMKAQEMLGAEAYIYGTQRIAEGIEVLVGVPGEDDLSPLPVQSVPPDYLLIENLNIKMQTINESMQRLFEQMTFLSQVVAEQARSNEQKRSKIWYVFNLELYRLLLLDQLDSMKATVLKVSAGLYHFLKLLKPERPNFVKKY